MALTSFADNRFDPEESRRLLGIARDSIRAGLKRERLAVPLTELTRALNEIGASFVTLTLDTELRGCIGTLEATQPLAVDVAENAYAAAFRDPRFAPLTDREFKHLHIHISILNPAESIHYVSETDLLRQIRVGTDGLILNEKGRRATLLPSVWETVSTPEEFLRHLKEKAGLPSTYWSDTLRVSRYTTTSIGDD